jgi:transposase
VTRVTVDNRQAPLEPALYGTQMARDEPGPKSRPCGGHRRPSRMMHLSGCGLWLLLTVYSRCGPTLSHSEHGREDDGGFGLAAMFAANSSIATLAKSAMPGDVANRPDGRLGLTCLKEVRPSGDMIRGLSWQHGGMRPTAYRRNARGLRDRQAFEGVRMQAGALFAAGHSQAEVVRQLGVARQNVSRWHALWRVGGLQALRSAGPTGHARRLSDQQLHRIDQALREGALAHGFDTDHWTLARVRTVIEQLTGVAYHPGHVWKLLRHRLHYRLQRPARRAIERDERAIARWVAEDWP